jgi:hypothetical protein
MTWALPAVGQLTLAGYRLSADAADKRLTRSSCHSASLAFPPDVVALFTLRRRDRSTAGL